jgi:hypothetical protein
MTEKTEAAAAAPAAEPKRDPLDHDGDGKKGGSVAGAVTKRGKAPPAPTQDAKPDELVTVRITKKGHGHVFDGEVGFYNWEDEVTLERSVGEGLEEKQFAEII